MKIQLLPETLANKIAAGEVVERPASVVKELIENSIDANSTHIKIHLMEAGLKEIKIADNGDGMGNADCKQAFLRHATSKIKYDADLFHIKSLGFRGEALASIASVSKLTLISSEGDKPSTILHLNGGEVVKEEKGDARKGTEIIVRDLFYNTPARLKYVKTIHTELGHITDVVNRYALGHPHIRFELTHQNKLIFKTTGSNNKLQVISQIYGVQVAKNVLHEAIETNDFNIEAFVVKPEITRANRRYITFIVNGRYIKNYRLSEAVVQGYGTLLPIHRFPLAIIYINLDPILVDVNVHPTKMEVRFSKEKELANTIRSLITNIFKKESLIPTMKFERRKKIKSEQEAFRLHLPNKQFDGQTQSKQPLNADYDDQAFIKETERQLTASIPSDDDEITGTDNTNKRHFIEKEPLIDDSEQSQDKGERVPKMYPIGQLQGTYILAQNELGFYMIDQHAAQERIKYEFFKQKLGQPDRTTQDLLMPLSFEFTLDEIILLEQSKEELASVGIELEPFGGQTYTVRSHPTWFPKGQEEGIIRDIIQQILDNEKVNIEQLREDVAILMACKRSIKANHSLSLSEMERLLEDLRKTSDPFTCPHGRPVIIHQSYYEIEKMFKRIM